MRESVNSRYEFYLFSKVEKALSLSLVSVCRKKKIFYFQHQRYNYVIGIHSCSWQSSRQSYRRGGEEKKQQHFLIVQKNFLSTSLGEIFQKKKKSSLAKVKFVNLSEIPCLLCCHDWVNSSSRLSSQVVPGQRTFNRSPFTVTQYSRTTWCPARSQRA